MQNKLSRAFRCKAFEQVFHVYARARFQSKYDTLLLKLSRASDAKHLSRCSMCMRARFQSRYDILLLKLLGASDATFMSKCSMCIRAHIVLSSIAQMLSRCEF